MIRVIESKLCPRCDGNEEIVVPGTMNYEPCPICIGGHLEREILALYGTPAEFAPTLAERALGGDDERAMSTLAALERVAALLEAYKRAVRAALVERMTQDGLAELDTDQVRVRLVAGSTSVSIDTRALKRDEELRALIEARGYVKTVTRPPSVRVEVK